MSNILSPKEVLQVYISLVLTVRLEWLLCTLNNWERGGGEGDEPTVANEFHYKEFLPDSVKEGCV